MGPFPARFAFGFFPLLGHVFGDGFAAFAGHDFVHEAEPFERIAGVVDVARVNVVQVVLNIAAGECRAAEDDGDVGGVLGVHFLQVFLHHHGGFHQEPGHAHHVGVVFPGGGDDGGDGLFDADVDDVVAVVAEDDIDQVFTDVVDVAFDGGNNHGAFVAGVVGCLHVVFEVGDGVFHGFGGLEDKGELHLAGAEEFAHGFHAAEEVLVDDVDGGFFGHGGIKVGFDAGFFPINNALGQAFE